MFARGSTTARGKGEGAEREGERQRAAKINRKIHANGRAG